MNLWRQFLRATGLNLGEQSATSVACHHAGQAQGHLDGEERSHEHGRVQRSRTAAAAVERACEDAAAGDAFARGREAARESINRDLTRAEASLAQYLPHLPGNASRDTLINLTIEQMARVGAANPQQARGPATVAANTAAASGNQTLVDATQQLRTALTGPSQ